MITTHNKLSRVAIFGASRGLGHALAKLVATKVPAENLLLVARQASDVGDVNAQLLDADMSLREDQDRTLEALAQFQPSAIYYCIGGGPYGPYGRPNWASHVWAYEVTLIFPARLLHWAMHQNSSGQGVQQYVVVGSAIAEDQPDLNAASYSSAKHGLHGLWRTVHQEGSGLDFRLFSPGYIDTKMVPSGAPVRQRTLWSPDAVAAQLWDWSQSGERLSHRKLAVYPDDR